MAPETGFEPAMCLRDDGVKTRCLRPDLATPEMSVRSAAEVSKVRRGKGGEELW